MNPVCERLERLRRDMQARALEAVVVPTDDIHQSEYVSPHFKFRAYLSGFTGSAGTLVVGLKKAGLWTDSRYFIQAERQLEGSGIELFKLKTPGCPSIPQWLLAQGIRTLGFDGEVFSASAALDLIKNLEPSGCQVVSDYRPYEAVWPERPALPDAPIYAMDEVTAGQTVASKLAAVRSLLSQAGADTLPLSGLDDIAWLLNLRGSDVDFNPVGLCFCLLEMDRCTLFVEASKLEASAETHLAGYGVELAGYRDMPARLAALPDTAGVMLNSSRLNYTLWQSLPAKCRRVEGLLPTTRLKALKNSAELAGFRRAMLKDGVAFVRFWRWLEQSLASGLALDEWNVGERLGRFRLDMDGCTGESFEPIVAFSANGAIVHYSASEEAASPVTRDGTLLIDHGGQYRRDGTTDMTRTLSLYEGPAPEEYLRDYAAVLKGNIALSQAVFPRGTRGCQLDVLARQFLWKTGGHYLHGTSHGIGFYLNVHEGPQSVRMEENPVELQAGMVISNEPGVYKEGRYGIRLETMMAVEERGEGEFCSYLGFETLTLCPLDLNSIDPRYYTPDELQYINTYHRRVYDSLSPYLDEDERAWLAEKTRAVQIN